MFHTVTDIEETKYNAVDFLLEKGLSVYEACALLDTIYSLGYSQGEADAYEIEPQEVSAPDFI